MKESKPQRDLVYYLTLFKLEGHETWRAMLSLNSKGFELQAKNDKWPKITERIDMQLDRLTGTFRA